MLYNASWLWACHAIQKCQMLYRFNRSCKHLNLTNYPTQALKIYCSYLQTKNHACSTRTTTKTGVSVQQWPCTAAKAVPHFCRTRGNVVDVLLLVSYGQTLPFNLIVYSGRVRQNHCKLGRV